MTEKKTADDFELTPAELDEIEAKLEADSERKGAFAIEYGYDLVGQTVYAECAGFRRTEPLKVVAINFEEGWAECQSVNGNRRKIGLDHLRDPKKYMDEMDRMTRRIVADRVQRVYSFGRNKGSSALN